MAIPFTDREMEKAWSRNLSAYHKTTLPRTNAHRLLLFYAVECGLKAMFMKQKKRNRTDLCPEISECQHNINKLLDCVNGEGYLRLPEIFMEDILDKRNNKKNKKEKRKLDSGQINQMWRYGGKVISTISRKNKKQATDEDIENKLLLIAKWIGGEINKL